MWRTGKKDLSGDVSREGLEKLEETEIRLIESFEDWDGVLNGTCEYQGKICWFDYINDCPVCDDISCDHKESGQHYNYILKALTKEQINELKPKSADYLGPNLKDVKPIGWFCDGKNEDFYPMQLEKPK